MQKSCDDSGYNEVIADLSKKFEDKIAAIYASSCEDGISPNDAIDQLKSDAISSICGDESSPESSGKMDCVKIAWDEVVRSAFRSFVFDRKKRLDGMACDEIRE